MAMFAPSYVYLSSHLDTKDTAFLSESDGFMPPLPLSELPAPFSRWHNLAIQLPSLFESGEWDSYIASIPDEKHFQISQLEDRHLLRANIALGSIAHAIYHVAKKPIPFCIRIPWKGVSERLGRSRPFLAPMDFLIYNHEPLSGHEGQKIVSPYTQLRPSITLTNFKSEANFLLKGYAVEHAARPLPKLIALAQSAVLNADDENFRNIMFEVVDVIENMTKAFLISDPRPLNKFAIDNVHWARLVDIFTLPASKEGKGSSGLLFSSIHLLDAFFGRRKFETELGQLLKHERPWLAQSHQQFLSKVTEVSVTEYLVSNDKKELLILFYRALQAFAGENGFLGRHRLQATGYMEIMFKVGRPATGVGLGEGISWDRRPWRTFNEYMKQSMRERVGMREDWFPEATVKDVSPVPGCDAYRVLIDGHGAFYYNPGDLLSILPENDNSLVQDVLHLLNLKSNTTIGVKNNRWVKMLACRGQCRIVDRDKQLQITATEFLRYANLQPLDWQLGSRLAQVMSVTDPTLVNWLQSEEASSVKTALQFLENKGVPLTKKLTKRLDEVFEPLIPRFYSIASHILLEPTAVEIVVGQVQYEAKPLITPNYSLTNEEHELSRASEPKERAANMGFNATIPKPNGNPHCHQLSFDRNRDAVHSNSQRGIFPTFSDCGVEPAVGERLGCVAETVLAEDCSLKYGVQNAKNQQPVETLQGVSSTYLRTISPGSNITARVISKPSFHMPLNTNVPVIMISHGTGFAPFRAFLQQLMLLAENNKRPQHRSWLVLGVKWRHSIPFLPDIERAVCKMKVADLSLAISREDFELDEKSCDHKNLRFRSGERKHVHDLFHPSREELKKLWHMVTQQQAHIYMCGKPHLEQMTRRALSTAARHFDPRLDATHFADSLAANNRLHADCYDSSKPASPKATFSHSQVAEQRNGNDCWVTFRGGVFDITRFLAVHPGGPKLLSEKGGRDITKDFEISHGVDNYRVESMLEVYRIGQLERYDNASIGARRVMTEWSVPLLSSMLERRAVFLLDWNQFDHDGPSGRYGKAGEAEDMLRKFEQIHEAQLFRVLESGLKENLPADLSELKGVVETVETIRATGRERMSKLVHYVAERAEREEVHAVLQRCAAAVDIFVKLATQMQRDVERSKQFHILAKTLRQRLLQCVKCVYANF